ncbi:MAG: trehalose-6-phosphate synthase [Deltaproteobacteria bacterium]|nr:trehalose-6-phosphate synthase [Deltaproteobacteria bacterium]
MWRTRLFAGLLLILLGMLAWGASVVVHDTTARWFAKDLTLRSQLAVSGARQALLTRWVPERSQDLEEVLSEISRDERIMAAVACNPDMTPLAKTPGFPEQFTCTLMGDGLLTLAGAPLTDRSVWQTSSTLPGGSVHVSAIPVFRGDRQLGFVGLIHDLSFLERRAWAMRLFLWITFGILALAAAGVTLVAVRLAWRGWSAEFRRFLEGGAPAPEFQPILRDVREFVQRLSEEREVELQGGKWTPQRLKNTLGQHLHGEKVVILANREPYIHERKPDGKVSVVHPASGLVTALEPVMRACSGVWVAHGGGSADKETTDAQGHLRVPPGEESYMVRRVWLTPEEEHGYYYGFSNEGLWPLCHIAHARPVFRNEDWKQYDAVNKRFAEAVCEEVDSDDPIVLVQDYHFAVAPRYIRERLPRATIISFWHIPFPNSERFGICPWRNELLEGMLGSSIIGFHTQSHCNNLIDGVDRFLEARIDREQNAIIQHGHRTLIRPYPISLEWPVRWVASSPSPKECRASVAAELCLPADGLIGVGVDRLDYTKGVEERLLAVESLLDRFPEYRGRFVFVQLAAPSRTVILRYRELNDSVEALAARINAKFGQGSYRPIALLRAHHEPPAVFRYYRAADVCYVSSLHDGMNLVAKEFVAARDDERGVLVLSQFTGAAKELTEALMVNPYDLEEASAALATALKMPAREQQDRLRAMRAYIAEFNVYRWAGRMLVDAARLRRKERLTGRLTGGFAEAPGSPS